MNAKTPPLADKIALTDFMRTPKDRTNVLHATNLISENNVTLVSETGVTLIAERTS